MKEYIDKKTIICFIKMLQSISLLNEESKEILDIVIKFIEETPAEVKYYDD